MANKKIWLGMAVLALSFGLVLAGCPTGNSDNDNDNNGNTPPAVTGVQVYTLNGTTFTAYAETGAEQTVTGTVSGGGDEEGNSIGNIGTISADGKLTLNLPATVEDSKLADWSTDSGISGLKGANLETTPSLYLVKSSDDYLSYVYLNKSGSFESVSFPKGWNYMGQGGPVSSAEGYKWVISVCL